MKPLLFFIVLFANGVMQDVFASVPRTQTRPATPPGKITGAANQRDAFLLENNRRRSENPPGVNFTLQLKNNRKQYQQGEIIRLELSFSSTIARRFTLNNATHDHSGRIEIDTFVLDHEDGSADPLEDYFSSYLFGFLGGYGSGMPELSHKPEVVAEDLNEWFRFDRPGRYRLYIVSKRVSRKVNANDQSGTHGLTVVSNVVDFEIVPAEKKWATQKISAATAMLDKQGPERQGACRILRFLGTEAAVSEIIKRFRGSDPYCDFEYDFGLIGSPHRDLVISAMEGALSAPEHPVTESFVRTLALLAFTRQASAMAPYPEEGSDEEKNRWQEQLEERRRSYEQLLLDYLRQVVTTVPHKQPEAQAKSIKTLLDYQTSFNAGGSMKLQGLLALLPAVFSRLPLDEQISLLTYRWKPVADASMLRVLRELYNKQMDHSKDVYRQRELRSIALLRLYELSPEEGRRVILEEISRPEPRVNQAVLRSIPDETLPELDDLLASNLEESRRENGSGDIEAISQLIERYGSAAILGRVQAVYEAPGVGRWACRIQSSLLAYFLRVDPSAGGELLKKALAARGEGFTRCYASALIEVVQLRMTSEVEEAARAALEENDPEIVSQAAKVLGQFGSSSVERKLWQRLERWHDEMQAQSAKLRKQNPGVPASGSSPLSGEALIEQSLRNALSQGQAWFSDLEKLKRLGALCHTDGCSNEVNGMIERWNQRIEIGLSPFEVDPHLIRVAQYQPTSIESLKQKLTQFPPGTTFTWAKSNSDFNEERADELFRQLAHYLKDLGMKLERESEQ